MEIREKPQHCRSELHSKTRFLGKVVNSGSWECSGGLIEPSAGNLQIGFLHGREAEIDGLKGPFQFYGSNIIEYSKLSKNIQLKAFNSLPQFINTYFIRSWHLILS